MISFAKASFVRISPRKVRYVIDLIRKKSVAEAQQILNGSPRRAGLIINNLLNQALDSAQKNSQISAKSLMVSCVMADGGPTMKRFRAATMGRGMTIRKRTSHIYLELDLAKKSEQALMPKKENKAKATQTPARPIVVKKEKPAAKKKLAGAK